MQIITLDGNRMTDKRTTHLYLAQTLRFPVYYGRNLDALSDCLTEFLPGSVIILRNESAMLSSLGEYGESLLEVFRNSSSYGIRFFVDPS